jgi:hypothetical protein
MGIITAPTLKTYIGNGGWEKSERALRFSTDKAHLSLVIRVPLNAAAAAVSAAAFGASVGVLGALIVNPPAMPIAGKVGGAVGAALGAYYGAEEQLVSIEKSPEYTAWLSKGIDETAYKPLGELCKDYRLKEFHCPLNKKLICIPVKDKLGHRWEHGTVMARLDAHGGSIPHPLHPGKTLTRDELVYDMDYHSEVQTATAQLQRGSPNAALVSGVNAYTEAVIKSRSQIGSASCAPLFEALAKGEITPEEFQRRIGEVGQQFSLKKS